MPKKIFFVLVLLFSLWAPIEAKAQILIEEGKVNLTVEPGKITRGKLTVHNTAADPMKLRVYLEDFQYVSPYDGKKKFFPGGSLPSSLNPSLDFAPKTLTLPAYGKIEVEYSVKLPAGAKGGYYGVLFVETASASQQGEIAMNIVARVGALLFIQTKDSMKTAIVQDMAIQDGKIKGGFSNKGDVILVPHGVYYVMDKAGMAVDRGDVATFYLPSGETTHFEIPLSQKLAEGNYNCVLTFDLEDGNSITREIEFTKSSANNYQIRKISE